MLKSEKFWKIFNIILKVLGITLLCLYCTQLLTEYAIDEHQVLPPNKTWIVILLKPFTIAAVTLGVLYPWFKQRNGKWVFIAFGFIIPVLTFVFFNDIMISWKNFNSMPVKGYAYQKWRIICFMVEQIVLFIMAAAVLFKTIVLKEFEKINPIYLIATLVLVPFLCLTPGFFKQLGYVTSITENVTKAARAEAFNKTHLLSLATIPVLFLSVYIPLRKEERETQRYVFTLMSLTAFYSFFYINLFSGTGVNFQALPLQLCNTAVLLCLYSFAFDRKRTFYFTFFVNVIGTCIAIIAPDMGTKSYWFTLDSYRYWFCHVVCFCLPLLAMSLGFFERPKFKSILTAICIFAGYVTLISFANAYLSNFGKANYFFLNDNTLFEKFNIKPTLKDEHSVTFMLGDKTMVMYPLFSLVVYIIFVAGMFILWYAYDFLFKVADSHKQIHFKEMLKKQNYIDFKKELNGRKPNEPLYLEDVNMIEIKHFTKVYSGSSKPSVEDLNLTIKDGEVYGFLGHNGAGKSTTIKSLVGIQSITEGQMIVDGYDVQKQPVEAKLRIGYVSDNHAVYERLTGREYINYIADLYMVPQKERDERIEKYTKMFKLEDAIDREIKSYSHGMKQKIVVISSLIHDPKVWVLDEPLTGLDPTSAYQIKECMREHASRGNIVFFSSHVIEVVEKICTRICIIGHGKLQCEYSLEELKEKGISLESLYLKYVSSEERIN